VRRSFVVGLALGVTSLALAEQPESRTRKSLERAVDTVVITGSDGLGRRLLRTPIGELRAYACRGGFMTPIQYQIDERDQEGRFVWTSGPSDRRTQDHDRGLLDTNDELLVLARDVGDRATAASLAQIEGHAGIQEIELTDPMDGGKAWIYLARFPGPQRPSRPDLDLVDLQIRRLNDEEAVHTWTGEHFQFNNARSPNNAVRATWAGLAPQGKRGFRRARNILDSTQVRAVASFMWVTVVRQSNDIKVRTGGLIDGPIRIVAENRMEVYLALGLWVSAPESYVILWTNRVSMPTNADCPVNLDESDESNYALGVDMRREVRGFKFYNSHNRQPVVIDGQPSAAERRLDRSYPDWNCVFGPDGAMLSKFVCPDRLRSAPGSGLLYVDDVNYQRDDDAEGIEFEPGAVGYHGYYVNMQGLPKGTYPGDYVVWYLPPPFRPGDEKPYLDEYERPIAAVATEHDGAGRVK